MMLNKLLLSFTISSLGFYSGLSFGQAGSLDLTFGNNGIIATSIGSAKDFASSIAFQSDGKIIAAGTARFGRYNDIALVRYKTTGFLDSLFGTNGIVRTPVGSYSDDGTSVIIQPDGKIIVCGEANNGTDFDFTLVRYGNTGIIDSTFGTNGKIITPIGNSNDYILSSMLQSDGKILVTGFSDNGIDNDVVLVRYNTNGSLDNTFSNDGIVLTSIGPGNDRGNSLVIQADGNIIVAGYANNGTDDDIALLRYKNNGDLDMDFGTDGKVTTDIANNSVDSGNSVMLQPDGKIVIAGETIDSINYNFAVLRYNTDGNLDSSFGTGGMVCTDVGNGNDYGHSLAIQSDGKIVVAGFSTMASYDDFSIVRYNTNGSLDNSFGSNGKSVISVGSFDDKANCLGLQADGKIVVVGASSNGANIDFTAIRINN
jgi:uncharacterized delta-60 repeat protein